MCNMLSLHGPFTLVGSEDALPKLLAALHCWCVCVERNAHPVDPNDWSSQTRGASSNVPTAVRMRTSAASTVMNVERPRARRHVPPRPQGLTAGQRIAKFRGT